MGSIDERIEELGITLPAPSAAVANYVPYVMAGRLLFVSGQISARDGNLIKGRIGETISMDDAVEAARHCGISLLSQCMAALGSLDRIHKVVKLGGFVNAAPDFEAIPHVINGCSDLMVDVFGDRGRHARSAVASPTLPLGVAVEIDGVFEITPD
ncbi:RidA family protein [Henriciella litoralis]|uniref:RidA family protein n=1 Tax=Henriciella litoralis TaxID=568102 RepID=UPI000A01CC81|nr:RidA family protein [Henriciella litoralis]